MEGPGHTMGMRQLASECHRRSASLQGLVSIAKPPQGPGEKAGGDDAGILPIPERKPLVVWGIIEYHSLFQMFASFYELSQIEQWSGQKSGGDSAVSSEFLIAGMIFHPSRVKS